MFEINDQVQFQLFFESRKGFGFPNSCRKTVPGTWTSDLKDDDDDDNDDYDIPPITHPPSPSSFLLSFDFLLPLSASSPGFVVPWGYDAHRDRGVSRSSAGKPRLSDLPPSRQRSEEEKSPLAF